MSEQALYRCPECGKFRLRVKRNRIFPPVCTCRGEETSLVQVWPAPSGWISASESPEEYKVVWAFDGSPEIFAAYVDDGDWVMVEWGRVTVPVTHYRYFIEGPNGERITP